MLSTSIGAASSPPGPSSSQSSSSGSYYSSSSSTRQPASGSSSNNTSPPTGSEHGPAPSIHFSPATKSIHQAQENQDLLRYQQHLSHPVGAFEDARGVMYSPNATYSSADGTFPADDFVGPSSGSPEEARGPAAKTRRTSPGGSRASDDVPNAYARSGRGMQGEYAAGNGPAAAVASDSRREGSVGRGAYERSDSRSRAGTPAMSSARSHHQREGSGSRSASAYSTPVYPPASTAYAPDFTNEHDRSNEKQASEQQPSYSQNATSSTASPSRTSRTRTHSQTYTNTNSHTRNASASSSYAGLSRESSASPARAPRPASPPHLDLATYPSQDLLRVLAMLLHQIATANDELRPSVGQAEAGNDQGRSRGSRGKSSSRSREKERSATAELAAAETSETRPSSSRNTSSSSTQTARPNSVQADGTGSSAYVTSPALRPAPPPLKPGQHPAITTAAMGALGTSSSTLCFHARNVPSISIESYLMRILKYCPTTNEVFLSLLVYFDRMSRMGLGAAPGSSGTGAPAGAAAGLPQPGAEDGAHQDSEPGLEAETYEHQEPHPGMRGFAIDSYNVHRLVIAGVTVASKFFSDVFYTNSRYAKVGGLPVHELNQLELQFLLLNDFRLVIPLDEMQRYADQLLVYGGGASTGPPRTKELGAPVSAPVPVQAEAQARAGNKDSATQSKMQNNDRSAAAVVAGAAFSRAVSGASAGAGVAGAGQGKDGQGDVRMNEA